jgi:hypothetical protein
LQQGVLRRIELHSDEGDDEKPGIVWSKTKK